MSRIEVGMTVTVKEFGTEKTSTYTLVPPAEADVRQGRISVQSPLGAALLTRSAGDELEVQLPRKKRTFTVISVFPDADETSTEA